MPILLFGRKHHDHPAAFHRGWRFYFTDVAELFGQVFKQIFSLVGIEHITPPKLNGSLYFISIFQELTCMPGFELKVVIVCLRTESEFFYLNCVLFLFRLFLFFLLFVHELTEVDNFTYGWIGIRCNLNQILFKRFSNLQGPFKRYDLVFFIRTDQADFVSTNLVVNIWTVVVPFSSLYSSSCDMFYLSFKLIVNCWRQFLFCHFLF